MLELCFIAKPSGADRRPSVCAGLHHRTVSSSTEIEYVTMLVTTVKVHTYRSSSSGRIAAVSGSRQADWGFLSLLHPHPHP
ncbi:hypothetical protein CGRA01v4_06727 [Colletotrichum graminicola]|nr:hypothetical protein CGRA01v4_06727 [Colletotrichum graminicola]